MEVARAAEAVTTHAIERSLPGEAFWSCKMVVMVTGIATAAIGFLTAFLASAASSAAAFFVSEVALIIGAFTVREHDKMQSLPQIAEDLRLTNVALEEQISGLESEIQSLQTINADLRVSADKVDSVYNQYVAAQAKAEEANARLESLISDEKMVNIRIEDATRRLEAVEVQFQARIGELRAEIDRLQSVDVKGKSGHTGPHEPNSH